MLSLVSTRCSQLLGFPFGSFLRAAAAAGQRDCRQKLDELRPYAPQLVAIAPDLEWVAQNELSIQLSIFKNRLAEFSWVEV
jgi:hypothetical protein